MMASPGVEQGVGHDGVARGRPCSLADPQQFFTGKLYVLVYQLKLPAEELLWLALSLHTLPSHSNPPTTTTSAPGAPLCCRELEE